VIISVLAAFHFDLSLSTAFDYYTARLKNRKLKSTEAVLSNTVDDDDEGDESDNKENNVISTVQQTTVVNAINTDSTNTNQILKCEKQPVGASTATKIHLIVTKTILPLLFKCLTKKSKTDEDHKVNKKSMNEDEQKLRVPMVLAILKLLNNLPVRSLEVNLPGLLLKVCEMLKSRALSVRHATRECLIKVVNTLDKKYYHYIFKELTSSLARGFQVHVLCYTIQILLKHMQPKFMIGDLDPSIDGLSKVFCLELFSQVSDEKEVKQILAKTSEAKTVSSFNSYEILAKYISRNTVLELIKPLKQVCGCTHRALKYYCCCYFDFTI
jgi:hypothetical protein